MNRTSQIACWLTVVLVNLCSLTVRADDWMTWRSTYTHDHQTGMRVDQYAAPEQPLSPNQGNLVKSGYRHYRSTIQGSTSADNLHMVHEWGRPVMPYEHWRFPYRPFGVPYQQWGPPVPSVWSNFNQTNQFGPNQFAPNQFAPNPGPIFNQPNSQAWPLVPTYQPAPWYDGLHPTAP